MSFFAHPTAVIDQPCPESGLRYKVNDTGHLWCIDASEDEYLPQEMRHIAQSYEEIRKD
jgi:hypothetical protein